MKTEREVLEEAVRDHLRRALTAVESARIALFDLLHRDPRVPEDPTCLDPEALGWLHRSLSEAAGCLQTARTHAGVIDG